MTGAHDLEEVLERQPLVENSQNVKQKRINDPDPRIRVSAKVNCFERRRRLKAMKEYYEYQDRLEEFYRRDEERLCHLDFDHRTHQKVREDEAEKRQRRDRRLARIVFVLNVILLVANLWASMLSRSYSVISAFIDNAMDLMSSLIVQFTVRAISNTNSVNYPRGRERLEIVAVIVCSTIMGITNIMMIVQSVEAILEDEIHPIVNMLTIGLLASGIASKVVLAIICYSQHSNGSRLLAMDLRNDVLTSAVALGGAYLGNKYWPYADPIGAILVCSFIAISWFANVFSTIPIIVGRRAEQEQISRVLRIASKHDARIRFLDHVLVYHLGERALVELHVVLDENLPLKVTHDLTEALDKKIRTLEFVERVFIHVDYQCDGDS